MTRSLVQIRKQIDRFQKEAEQVRAREVALVIARIKSAIDFYGLTTNDLFGPKAKSVVKGKQGPVRRAKTKVKKAAAPAKYRDKASGKTWTGHGKRPGWFVQAIDSGMKAEEMAA